MRDGAERIGTWAASQGARGKGQGHAHAHTPVRSPLPGRGEGGEAGSGLTVKETHGWGVASPAVPLHARVRSEKPWARLPWDSCPFPASTLATGPGPAAPTSQAASPVAHSRRTWSEGSAFRCGPGHTWKWGQLRFGEFGKLCSSSGCWGRSKVT